MKGEYTEKVHAKRLIKMLKEYKASKLPYHCPAHVDFDIGYSTDKDWPGSTVYPCVVCRTFVGVNDVGFCPCVFFANARVARSKTIAALKKGGYIKSAADIYK